jgi:hypothetical protein
MIAGRVTEVGPDGREVLSSGDTSSTNMARPTISEARPAMAKASTSATAANILVAVADWEAEPRAASLLLTPEGIFSWSMRSTNSCTVCAAMGVGGHQLRLSRSARVFIACRRRSRDLPSALVRCQNPPTPSDLAIYARHSCSYAC